MRLLPPLNTTGFSGWSSVSIWRNATEILKCVYLLKQVYTNCWLLELLNIPLNWSSY